MLVHVSASSSDSNPSWLEEGFKNGEDRISCSQIDSMPLPDGSVPDEPQIVPDTGLECRFTASKASTDTRLHHTSRGVPVPEIYIKGRPSTRNIYHRRPPVPEIYIKGRPQYQICISRGAPSSKKYALRCVPNIKNYTLWCPQQPEIQKISQIKGRPTNHKSRGTLTPRIFQYITVDYQKALVSKSVILTSISMSASQPRSIGYTIDRGAPM